MGIFLKHGQFAALGDKSIMNMEVRKDKNCYSTAFGAGSNGFLEPGRPAMLVDSVRVYLLTACLSRISFFP